MILQWMMNTEIPIQTLKDWLDSVDANKNGKVSVRELMEYVKSWYRGFNRLSVWGESMSEA